MSDEDFENRPSLDSLMARLGQAELVPPEQGALENFVEGASDVAASAKAAAVACQKAAESAATEAILAKAQAEAANALSKTIESNLKVIGAFGAVALAAVGWLIVTQYSEIRALETSATQASEFRLRAESDAARLREEAARGSDKVEALERRVRDLEEEARALRELAAPARQDPN